MVAYLWSSTKSENLCLAGGVILNSVVNGKLKKISKFKNVHITSAPGDNGAAIGAAIYGKILKYNKISENLIRFDCQPYLGKDYSQDHIKKAIAGSYYSAPKYLENYIADSISKGLIVACYQGRSEFGPRALVEQHAASLNSLFLDSSLTSEDGHSSPNKNRQEVSNKQLSYFNEVKDAMLVTQSYNFLQGPFAEQLLENSSKFQDKALRRAARDFIQQCDPESFSAFMAKRQQDSFQEKFSTFMENTESVIEKISAPLANTYLGDALGIDRTKPKMKLSR